MMSDSNSLPLVSCLLVTADRPDLCRRALLSFQKQNYPNRELVVLDNGVRPMRHLLDEMDQSAVRYIRVEPTPSTVIGGLRNVALEAAEGEYVVPQWDDDDWSHPERLSTQIDALGDEFDACVLAGTLMHVDREEYFDRPFIGLLANGVPPTIVHRNVTGIRYPELRRTSDSVYLDVWRERRVKVLPKESSHLYVRYFHGGNLWEQEHFLRRMRNTIPDAVKYAWYKYVRNDLFSHPRFRLDDKARKAFQMYLDDSFFLGLFSADGHHGVVSVQ